MALKHLLASLNIAAASASLLCQTQSQPNPIAGQYPNVPTGTLNGTITIVPIPYSLARSIVPAKYGILTSSYRSLLPASFPPTSYPLLLQADLDHDVQSYGIVHLPDFHLAKFIFPFVDRLGDGYSTFIYGTGGVISADNLVALGGAAVYGDQVVAGRFEPPCDGYAFAADGETKYYRAYDATDLTGDLGLTHANPVLNMTFKTTQDESPYTMAFWKNVTNQPQFSANAAQCDHFVRFFNSSVSAPPYAPQNIRATVSTRAPVFPETRTWTDVWGLQIDTAFAEYNLVSCDMFKGYQYEE